MQVDLSSNETVPRTIQTSAVDSEVVMELESANSNTNVGSEVAIDLESDNSNTVTLANTTLLYIHLKYNKTK